MPPLRHCCVPVRQYDHKPEYLSVRLRLEALSDLINKVRVVCILSAGVTRSRVLHCHCTFPFVFHDQPLGEDFLWRTYDEKFYMGLQRCRNPRSLQYVMSGSRKLEVIVTDFGGIKACECVCVCARARARLLVILSLLRMCKSDAR
jgi:hypothetical protein